MEKPTTQYEVVHIMADGSVRDSLEGYEVPYNENTEGYYKMLAQARKEMREEVNKWKNLHL